MSEIIEQDVEVTAIPSTDVAEEVPKDEPLSEPKEAPPTENSDAETAKQNPKKVNAQQRKISKLSYQNRELNRKVDSLLEQVDGVRKQQTDAIRPPKIEDFENVDDYLDERDKYQANKNGSKKPEPPSETSVDPTEIHEAIDELREAGTEKYDDFEELVFSEDMKITPAMRDAILTADDTDTQADLAYYLGKNPKEVARLAKLSPLRQVKEIGKLEQKLSSQPTPRPSKAPAPIQPVGGKNTPSKEHKTEDSMETFMQKRNKELGRG